MNGVERWISMDELCAHLCVSRDTVKKMIKAHGLPAYKIDRKWKFKISEVDAWMHKQNSISIKTEVSKNVKND